MKKSRSLGARTTPPVNKLGPFEYLGPDSIFRLDKVEPPFGARVLRREENAVRKDVCAACGLAQGMTDCAVVKDARGHFHVVGEECLHRFAVNFVLDDPSPSGSESKGGELVPPDPDNKTLITKRERDEYWKVYANAANSTRIHPNDPDGFIADLIVRGRAIGVTLPPLPKLSPAARLAWYQLRASAGWPKDITEDDRNLVDRYWDAKQVRSKARGQLLSLRIKLAIEMLRALPADQRKELPVPKPTPTQQRLDV